MAHLRSSRGQLAGPLTEGTAAVGREFLASFFGPGGGFQKQSRLAAARAAVAIEREARLAVASRC
jgi:hypothetical protein